MSGSNPLVIIPRLPRTLHIVCQSCPVLMAFLPRKRRLPMVHEMSGAGHDEGATHEVAEGDGGLVKEHPADCGVGAVHEADVYEEH